MKIDPNLPPRWKELYALYDPREPEVVKYIGCADDPAQRFVHHLHSVDNAPVNEWIRWLRTQGVEPLLIHLGTVRSEVAPELERCLIKLFEPSALNVVGTPLHNAHRSWTGDALTLEEMRAQSIRRVLKQCGGNKQETARRLGIGRQTLYNALERMTTKEKSRLPT